MDTAEWSILTESDNISDTKQGCELARRQARRCGSTVIGFYSETFRKIDLNTLKTGALQCSGRANQDNILKNTN